MKEKIRENIENELNTKLTDEQFEEAYEMAAMKQQFVFAREHRNVIMSIWYLEMLVLEYVRNLAFSHYTMDLCEVCGNKKSTYQTRQALTKPLHIVVQLHFKINRKL